MVSSKLLGMTFMLALNSLDVVAKSQCDLSRPPFEDGAKAHRIAGEFKFLEGPTWSVKLQRFYFSEMDFGVPQTFGPPAKIYQLTLPDQVSVFLDNAGSNGLLVDNNRLIALTHNSRTVSFFDLKTKTKQNLATNYSGKRFNSPNDVAQHSSGNLYFTDPDWQLSNRKGEIGLTGVYKLNQSGEVELIDGELNKPNGIVFSPNEDKLYVGDYDNRISVYPVTQSGRVGKRKTFAYVASPDGMTVDCAGNLYVAAHSEGKVVVLSPSGNRLTELLVGPNTTNVEFGGPDLRTLLITTANGLYKVTSKLPGLANAFPK